MRQENIVKDAVMGVRLAPLLFLTIVTTSGCSGIHVRSKDGVDHHLILGIGMISIKEQPGVSVEDVRVLGVMIGRGGLNAGLRREYQVEIDPRAASNIVISIRARPFSLIVTNFDCQHAVNTNLETTGGRE